MKKSKEELFWIWFSSKSNIYFDLLGDRTLLFKQLKQKLDLIDTNLVFEFSTQITNGKRELVISADGIKDSFDSVKALVNVAPTFPKWKIIAFRPARSNRKMISYNDIMIDFSDTYFTYTVDSGKFNLDIYINGYKPTTDWTNACFVMLDHLIGEYDSELYLGYINKFNLVGINIPDKVKPIIELLEIIKDFKIRKSN